jgi:hypothetical protein
MGFWGSLFGGSNPTLDKGIKQAGQVSQFSTGLGEKLTTQSGNLISSLLSGDPSKSSQLLAPQTNAMRERAQQGKQELAQFGTRSGGTAGAAAGIEAGTRGEINNFISSLTSSALGAGMSMGKSLLDTGMDALTRSVGFSQEQMENWANSIAGMGITSAIASAESYGMGKAGIKPPKPE